MKYTVEVDKRATRWHKEGTKTLHRLDGPAVEWRDGSKIWYVNGKLHRLDGPAYEGVDGKKVWYVDGELHRLDGPAYEGVDGTKIWYVDGEQLTEEEFIKRTQPAKKMTVAEIQDALGFKVEIVE